MTSHSNKLTALRKAILKNKEVTADQLYELGTWFQLLALLKAGQKAKKMAKKKKK